MFCIHCGKEIPEGSSFCIHCGGETAEVLPNDDPIQAQPLCEAKTSSAENGTAGTRSIPCPHCKATKAHPINKSSTQVSGGGYSCCAGGCGGLLMGPIGLLCGLCGSGQTVTTSNQTWWVCMACGHEFRGREEAKKMVDAMAKLYIICFGAGIGICGSVVLGTLLAISEMLSDASGIFFLACGVACIAIGGSGWWGLTSTTTQTLAGYSFSDLVPDEDLESWEREHTKHIKIYAAVFLAVGIIVIAMMG